MKHLAHLFALGLEIHHLVARRHSLALVPSSHSVGTRPAQTIPFRGYIPNQIGAVQL